MGNKESSFKVMYDMTKQDEVVRQSPMTAPHKITQANYTFKRKNEEEMKEEKSFSDSDTERDRDESNTIDFKFYSYQGEE